MPVWCNSSTRVFEAFSLRANRDSGTKIRPRGRVAKATACKAESRECNSLRGLTEQSSVGWQSGLSHFFAKEAGPEKAPGGSNPPPTAKHTLP